MPPNKSNDKINSSFTLPPRKSTAPSYRIPVQPFASSISIFHRYLIKKRNKNSRLLIFKMFFTTAGKTASSMYSAILNGIVGVHIDKRVAIGTRSANQNPEFRRICRGVMIEARSYEYSISFPGDLIRDTAHAERQFLM